MVAKLEQPNPHTAIVALSGKLIFQARHAFQAGITQALQTSPRLLILDVAEISHIDSAGLGLLALAHKNLSPSGIRLAMANAQGIVRETLLLANIEKWYPLHDSVEAASRASTTTSNPKS